MNLNFNDFQKQDVTFDIDKLQKAYSTRLEILALQMVFQILENIINTNTW